ncbi:MAG: hypothetical protein AAF548_13995 [Actinomycetota bacterium]
MTRRTRLIRFVKRVLRIGQSGDHFFGGRPVSGPNATEATRSTYEVHSRSMQ